MMLIRILWLYMSDKVVASFKTCTRDLGTRGPHVTCNGIIACSHDSRVFTCENKPKEILIRFVRFLVPVSWYSVGTSLVEVSQEQITKLRVPLPNT